MPINEKEFEKMANSPSTREIIEQLRSNGWTDTAIIDFLLKVLPPK